MIFVTVGTIQYPFDRLARAVNDYARKNSKERIIIQSGYTKTFKKAPNVIINDFYSFKKMRELVRTAHLVITQAGEGSIFQALILSNNPPIVIPRNPRFHEHVDAQQLEIARVLKKRNLSVVLPNPRGLIHAIENYTLLSKNLTHYIPEKPGKKTLINSLTNCVTDLTK